METVVVILWTFVLSCALFLPISSDYQVQFTLSDNNPPQSRPIGNIITKLQSPISHGPYQILTKKCSYSKFNQYFRILDSGDLMLSRALDRDDVDNVCGPLICCDKSKCNINLEVIVTAQRSRQKYNVRIIIDIIDENDNSPKFDRESYSISILENERIHNRYRLPSAFDKDSPIYRIKSYILSGKGGDTFSLKLENKEPFLIPKKSFDFEDELQRKFELFLTAEDEGGKTGVLTVVINIIDANDNTPVCLDLNGNVTVFENTTYTRPIYEFRASDLDSGYNGKITYTLSTTTVPTLKDIFQLDNDTGSLFLIKKLDFELYSEQNFKITIQASDNGMPQLSDFCSLEIRVADLNDNSPIIDIVEVQPLPENTMTKDPVVKFYVRDDDTTDNEVSCRADRSSPGLRLHQAEKFSYLIYASEVYDHEITTNLTMLLICQDSGKIPQITEQLMTIPIKDKNDNTPIFPKSNYNILIAEDFPLLTPFITLKAFDKDSEEFGMVKYKLSRESKPYFLIGVESGEITLSKYLDRELKDVYNITVIGVDAGNLKGYTNVELRVTDINDNAPVLAWGMNMNVSENVPPGTVVGHFAVSDLDLGENGLTEWKVELLDNSTTLLKVDNVTIVTAGDIDRETDDVLYVFITMIDKGTPQLTSTATVTISILDQNDNIPEVIYPRPGAIADGSDSITIPTNAPKLTHVLTIKSHDPDVGLNGHVFYQMLHSNGSKYFTINHTDGQVRTNWAYDTISFAPTHPKEGLYRISFTIYNQARSTKNISASTTSFFYIRVIPYKHFINSEVFQQQHRRPLFNNIILLILIGGFTVSLSVALIAAIIWAKTKYSSESNNLEQAQVNDGKFMMMMMSGEQQNTNHNYVYDPYSSLMMDHDRSTDNGYPINHSRSSTFNTRRTGREHALWNHYENKTVPRNIIQPDPSRYCGSDICNNSNSLSTTDLASGASTTGRQPKLTNSFYRHFEHDDRCHSPILQSINRNQTLENQYGSISPMRASICDPTPNIATTSNWVPRVPTTGDDSTNSYTMC